MNQIKNQKDAPFSSSTTWCSLQWCLKLLKAPITTTDATVWLLVLLGIIAYGPRGRGGPNLPYYQTHVYTQLKAKVFAKKDRKNTNKELVMLKYETKELVFTKW